MFHQQEDSNSDNIKKNSDQINDNTIEKRISNRYVINQSNSSIERLKDGTGNISKAFEQIPFGVTDNIENEFQDSKDIQSNFQVQQRQKWKDSDIQINEQIYDSIDDSDYKKSEEESDEDQLDEASDQYSQISDDDEIESYQSENEEIKNQDQQEDQNQFLQQKDKELKDTLISKDDSKQNDIPLSIQQKIDYKQLKIIKEKLDKLQQEQKQIILNKVLGYMGLQNYNVYPQIEELNFLKFEEKKEESVIYNPILQANKDRKKQKQRKSLFRNNYNSQSQKNLNIDNQQQDSKYEKTNKVQFKEDLNTVLNDKNEEQEENDLQTPKPHKFQLTKPLGIRMYDNQQDNEHLSTESEDIEKEIVINNDYRKFLLAQDSEQYLNDQGPVNLKQNYEGFIQEYFVNDSKSFQQQIPSFIIEKYIDNEFPPVLASISDDVEHGYLQTATGYIEWRRVSDIFEKIKNLDTNFQYDYKKQYQTARSNFFIEIFIQAIYDNSEVGKQLINLEYDREKGIIKVSIPLMQTAVYMDDFLPINLLVNELSGMEDIKFLFFNPSLNENLNFFAAFLEKFFAKIFNNYENLQFKSLEDLLSIFQFEDCKFQEINFGNLDQKQKMKSDFFSKIQESILRQNQLLFLKDDCRYLYFKQFHRQKELFQFCQGTKDVYMSLKEIINSKKTIIILKIIEQLKN